MGNNGLQKVIDYCNLMHLPFSGPQFTWTNSRLDGGRICERIDYSLCNAQWSQKFPGALLHHLPMTSSDHHPLLLQLSPIALPQSIPDGFGSRHAGLNIETSKTSFGVNGWRMEQI